MNGITLLTETTPTITQETYNAMFLDELQDISYSNICMEETLRTIAESVAVQEQILYYLLAIGLVIVLYGMFKFVSKFLDMFF